MKKVIFCLIIIFVACEDRTRTFNYTYFQNDSVHKISVIEFSQGKITNYMSFDLQQNEKKQIISTQYPGIGGNGQSYADLTSLTDSILVIFDNKDTIIHYGKSYVLGGAKKFILYNSPRSLLNSNNYTKTTLTKTTNRLTYSFLYTFTEQDYLDASQ